MGVEIAAAGNPPTLLVAADIGGTFTDVVCWAADGTLRTAKVLSTPDDFSRGIVEGLLILLDQVQASSSAVTRLFHATTVATNAILEEKSAKTALITTLGFRDVLELRRIRVPELYNFFLDKPHPMVPRHLRFEVDERLKHDGSVLSPLDDADVDKVLDRIAEEGVEALAICLMHSYANPSHEEVLAKRVQDRFAGKLFVTHSAELVPEVREYERTSTVVINASVGPIVHEYLTNLVNCLNEIGVRAPMQVMTSNGGLMGVPTALLKPAAMVESGPAAGVIGAAHLAAQCGLANAITLDMGGTTAKAGIIEDGTIARTSEYEVGAGINVSSQLVKGRGHALKLPVVDLSEIGAGGGSIAAVDENGILHVGPHSAGSAPGPVCYGLGGTNPTLTDAIVTLGYLNPTAIAGGQISIDAKAAQAAIDTQIAIPLGKLREEAAHGIFLLAAAAMTRAVKTVSTFRGRDPREFALIAFGGNGPLVAAQIADELSMGRILIPASAGVFSAVGLLAGRAEQELSQALLRHHDGVRAEEVASVYAVLAEKAADALRQDGYDPQTAETRRFADLRYAGQAYELTISVAEGLIDDAAVAAFIESFHAEHEATYGHAARNEPVEMIGLRLKMIAASDEPLVFKAAAPVSRSAAKTGRRKAYFGPDRGWLETAIVARQDLSEQPRPGPIIVEDLDTTCLVSPGWSAMVDGSGNLVLERSA